MPFFNGITEIVISVAVLLLTDLFFSFFVGDAAILSGMKREEKLMQKTESEVKRAEGEMEDREGRFTALKTEMDQIKHLLEEEHEHHHHEQ